MFGVPAVGSAEIPLGPLLELTLSIQSPASLRQKLQVSLGRLDKVRLMRWT